jgi:hypothetical protein
MALGNIQDPRAAEALDGALKDKDLRVRAAAARVLARNNAPQGAPAEDPGRAAAEQAREEAEQFPAPPLPAVFDVGYQSFDPATKAALGLSADGTVGVTLHVEANQVRLVRDKNHEAIIPAAAIGAISFFTVKTPRTLVAAVVGGLTLSTTAAVAAAEHLAATKYLVTIMIWSENFDASKPRIISLECGKDEYKSIVAALRTITGKKAGIDFARPAEVPEPPAEPAPGR